MKALLNTSADKRGPITKRYLWTWDHSTEWLLNKQGSQTMGACNYSYRTAEDFIGDYTNLFKWAGKHNIDGVVVWGLLRDPRGGIEAAKKVCNAALKNNIKLLSGAGLNAYGGVYYEGDSKYSLENHLKKHPKLNAIDKKGNKLSFMYYGKPLIHACPSRKENQDFAAESLRWLMKTLPLAGVQIESGDTGVCQCKLCRDRRENPDGTFSWDDMVLMYNIATKAIFSVKKDAVILAETYSMPEYDERVKETHFGCCKPKWADSCIDKFPKGVIIQWVADDLVEPFNKVKWTEKGNVYNGFENIMRMHYATYWRGLRGELAADWISDLVKKSIAHGFTGIELFGEVSAENPNAELNYLALENYGSGKNPDAELDIFIKTVAAPLFGGVNPAKDYFKFAKFNRTPAKIRAVLPKILKNCAKFGPAAGKRWAFLANYLSGFISK